jgi:hypothetical protein
MTDKAWKRPFDDPIPLPRGRQLVTLQDAGPTSQVAESGSASTGMADRNAGAALSG